MPVVVLVVYWRTFDVFLVPGLLVVAAAVVHCLSVKVMHMIVEVDCLGVVVFVHGPVMDLQLLMVHVSNRRAVRSMPFCTRTFHCRGLVLLVLLATRGRSRASRHQTTS